MSREYGNNSISSLKGAEQVRYNPANFLGSKGIDGAKHTLVEMVGNSTDEYLSGFGDELIMKEYADGHYSLRDFGRGVPLGWNEVEKDWNYLLIYERLFSGGKYDKEGENQKILKGFSDRGDWQNFRFSDYPYMITIGMNGVGASCTQFTSTDFEVISYRGGKASRMLFEKGVHILDKLEEYDTDEKDGTFVKWRPDPEVFDDVAIPSSYVKGLCHTLAITTGMKITYINEKKGTEDVFESSTIVDEIRDACGSVATGKYTHHTINNRGDVCVCEVEVAVGPGSGSPKYFNNMIEISGGSHALGLDGALSQFFSEIGREKNIRFKTSDYSGKLIFKINTLANNLSVRGQTKDSLDDEYIRYAIHKCVYDTLNLERVKGTKWLMDVIEDVEYSCSLRMAQEELLKNHRELEKVVKKHKLSEKFVSCENYRDGKYDDVELYIVEGDSACGAVKNARSSKFQCLLQIRGKSLNVYKATIDKLLENKEIQDFSAALGCGIDLGIEGYDTFDMSKLKVGNIYLFPDADIDGKHILMLLFLICYRLFPELLYQGKVWVIDSPLYVINTKSDKSYYCMNEEEMSKKRAELGSDVLGIDRFKGWGEANSDDLWNTCLNPEVRVARSIKIERDDTELADVLEVLFGKSTDRRKSAILGTLIDGYDGILDGIENIDDWISSQDYDGEIEVETVELY